MAGVTVPLPAQGGEPKLSIRLGSHLSAFPTLYPELKAKTSFVKLLLGEQHAPRS